MKASRNIGVLMLATSLVVPSLLLAGCGTCGGGRCGRKAGGEALKKACGPNCTKPCCAAKKAGADISTAALKTLLSAGAQVTVLDARTGKYDDGRRIPGAASLSPQASAEDAAKLIKSKDSLVVTYCANLQCPASAMLAKRLAELGYKNILAYPHGIAGWADSGNKVEQASK